MKWYFAIGDKPCGPVERAELEASYVSGQITASTMVLQEGMYDWVPFIDMKKTTQFLPSFGNREKDKAQEKPQEEDKKPEHAMPESGRR